MKNKIKFIAVSLMLVGLITGCSSEDPVTPNVPTEFPGSATIKIYKNEDTELKNRFISPKNVEIKYTYDDLSGILSNNENVCPSTGDVNLLVIPVHVPGSEEYRLDKVKEDIEEVFFSENSDKMGFKSLKEFYKESSYGKLNFNGEVTDWFDLSEHTNIKNASDITMGNGGTIVSEILEKAVNWATTTQGINLKDYDKNEDGSIDAVWMVYDHLDYVTELQKNPNLTLHDINQAFWNFTSWNFLTEPNLENPTTSAFSWASFDMMYTSYCETDENDVPSWNDSTLLDSHTFIHETGHLLGLDDYYVTDGSVPNPLGCYSMMDQNIGDLDSYSKMLLGWVTPYVVYGSSEIIIPRQTASPHSVIVIPSNYEQISGYVEEYVNSGSSEEFIYEFNPFSEYLMIDLYSPDGLNYYDTFGENIINSRKHLKGPSSSGVRIYHVDSRIFKCAVLDSDNGQVLTYVDGYEWDGRLDNFNSNEAILMPINNTKIESQSFQLPMSFDYFEQIRLLEASKTNTFDQGGNMTDATLWKKGTEPFDIATFGYQFFNSNYSYNNGIRIPFKIKVLDIKEAN